MSFPGTYNISYYYGDTLEFRIFPKNSSGQDFDLSTFELSRFTIAPRRGAPLQEQILCFAAISPDQTNILCAIRPEDSQNLDPGTNYVYDVEIFKTSNQSDTPYDIVYTLLTGNVSITEDVTKSDSTPPPQPPGPASNIELLSATSNSISVTWDAPTTGGTPTGYQLAIIPFTANLQALQTAVSESEISVSGLVTSETFSALDPETQYSVIVLPFNDGGTAPLADIATNATPFSTLEEPLVLTVPDAPVIIGVDEFDEALEIVFTQDSDGNAEITNYEYSVDDTNYIAFDPAQTTSPLTISNLTNDVTYTVRIKAVNSEGSSDASNPANGTPTAELTAPSAPTIDSIDESDQQLSINFTQGNDGGSPITNYKYSLDGESYVEFNPPQVKPTEVTFAVTVQNVNGSNKYFIDGVEQPALTLYRGVTYTFDQSDGSNSTHQIYLSETNDGVHAGGTEYTSGVTYTGTAGTDGALVFVVPANAPDTLYYVCVNHSGMGTNGVLNIENFALIISGLTNGTTYPVTIKATNSVGDSGSSNSVNATPTTPTAPEAPTIDSIDPGNEELLINFTPGADGGLAITNYKYSLDGSTYTAFDPAQTTSPLTLTGLNNDEEYNITIKAVNAEGDSDSSNSVSATPVAPEPEPDFVVTSSGSSAYIINGVSNDTLTLVRGQTYIFDINASGHPFFIQTSSGAYNSQNVYNDGITGNGTQVGTLTWAVDQSAPSTLYYVCQFHPSMAGVINIIDEES